MMTEAHQPKLWKRLARCFECGKVHELDNPIEWEFTNVARRELTCTCGNDKFLVYEVYS